MRVLVTGGCGFIGHHIVKSLLARGDSVVVVDNMSAPGSYERTRPATVYVNDVTDWFSGGGVGGIGTLPDLILHLAAVSRTMPAIENPLACMMTNVMGTLSVLEYARQKKIPRVVVSSSNVVYAADTPYKASKLMMEEACKAYHETYGVSVICLRYSNVYGPGFAKWDLACLAAMRDSLVDRGYLEVTGDGEQTRDFTHVEDIVEGNLLAAKSDYCGTVDLCTGVNVSMNQASQRLFVAMPRTALHPFTDGPYFRHIPDRRGDCKHIIQDPGPAKEILGWEAKVKFEDGVKDVWRY